MGPILIELSPNRLLLDSNFDGYKLSLQEMLLKKKELEKSVDRVLLNSSQYSLLQTKLYGLHNHLIGDHLDDGDSIYFIDSDWNVWKMYLDPFSDDLIEPIKIWEIPRTSERKTGDYNVTLKFVNESLAILADGTGVMYIIDTGLRKDDDVFTVTFSDRILQSSEGFIIVDAVLKTAETQKEELHVLLLNIKQITKEEQFASFLYWVSFTNEDNHWQQIAYKEISTRGDIQYAALEKNCNAVYIVSDSDCKFITNSDCPVETEEGIQNRSKTYQWTQNIEEITIKFPLSENVNKELVNVICKPTEIEVKYNENKLLSGQLHQRIESGLTTWTVNNNNLEVVLYKNDTGIMWSELVKGDQSGEYIVDSCIVEDAHEGLGHVCSDVEAMPQCGTTFTSQQVEECDFENDKAVTFERLNGLTNNITHKIYLGSHQVLLTANLNNNLPPALGVRHDVDVCLWQPQGCGDDFSISHEGTLLAFGYIQASKQNRKFSVCPPDMNYSVICESSGHLFIYRQKKPISTGELRNRTTGTRINTIGEQQVLHLANEEVIGIYATNKTLYLLCENSVKVLKF